jgi:uncharacterized membrane protein YdbT with pleckstrin-like domain
MIRLRDNEQVLLVVRKHWFVFVAEAFFLVFLLLLPLLAWFAFQLLPTNSLVTFDGHFGALMMVITSMWLLFLWVFFFIIWTDYYLDVLVVTNQQIIDVEQKGLFSREISNFRLDRIQDVTAEMDGIIQTFFKFGTLEIQTAGDDRNFLIFGIPKPFEVKHFISVQHDAAIERLRTVSLSASTLAELRDEMHGSSDEQIRS